MSRRRPVNGTRYKGWFQATVMKPPCQAETGKEGETMLV